MDEYDFKTEVSNLDIAMLGLVIYKDIYNGNILSLVRNDDRKFLLDLVFESVFKIDQGEESLFFKNQKELTGNNIKFCIEVKRIINSYNINNENGKIFQETGIAVKTLDFRKAVEYAFAKTLEAT